MNVRGERILIFGDSLSHYGQDSAPEVWEPPSTALVTSSAPGSVLASLLLQQGAQATRTNARVGRSAASFYDREDATGLINADRAWRPTKVIVMLGTNDIGRSIDKTTAAMAGIKSAYEGMGAEVWAVGPFTYNNASLNAQANEVVQVMQNVFGARFIDGRPLSIQSGRTGDGVHFGAAAAKQTALNVANAVMTKTTAGDMLGVMALGAAIGIGAFVLFRALVDMPSSRQLSDIRTTLALADPNPEPRKLQWKKIDKGVYEATSPEGTFRIDGNNAGRNRWTITYPDGDYAMADALAEAKIWAETWRKPGGTAGLRGPRRGARQQGPRYQVFEIDNTGRRVLVSGAKSPAEAAKRAARLVPDINADSFAQTWNAQNASESASYEIGPEDDDA